jgi:hypothetical protein
LVRKSEVACLGGTPREDRRRLLVGTPREVGSANSIFILLNDFTLIEISKTYNNLFFFEESEVGIEVL